MRGKTPASASREPWSSRSPAAGRCWGRGTPFTTAAMSRTAGGTWDERAPCSWPPARHPHSSEAKPQTKEPELLVLGPVKRAGPNNLLPVPLRSYGLRTYVIYMSFKLLQQRSRVQLTEGRRYLCGRGIGALDTELSCLALPTAAFVGYARESAPRSRDSDQSARPLRPGRALQGSAVSEAFDIRNHDSALDHKHLIG